MVLPVAPGGAAQLPPNVASPAGSSPTQRTQNPGSQVNGVAKVRQAIKLLASALHDVMENQDLADEVMKAIKGVGSKAPANQATAWHHLSQANPFLKNMAERYGFSILDLDPVFRLAAKHHCRGQLFDPVDGVHLRPVGELIIASSLSRLINIWQEPA